MKHVLWVYGLILVILLATSTVREGFEFSPQALQDMDNKKVLLLVTWKDCPYCKKLKPTWDTVAAKYPDKMVSIEKDDPAAQDLLTKLNVNAFPSMFVMDHGKSTPFDGRTEQEILAEVSSL